MSGIGDFRLPYLKTRTALPSWTRSGKKAMKEQQLCHVRKAWFGRGNNRTTRVEIRKENASLFRFSLRSAV